MNTETQATENTEQTPQLPTITEERLLASAFIGQAISKDGLFPHVIVTTGFRYGGIVRTMIAWAPQGHLTPASVAVAMGIPYDPQQGDFIHIEMIANVNALMGIPEAPVLNVVRSTYQVQQGAAPAAEEAPAADAKDEVSTEAKAEDVASNEAKTDSVVHGAENNDPVEEDVPEEKETAPEQEHPVVQHVPV